MQRSVNQFVGFVQSVRLVRLAILHFATFARARCAARASWLVWLAALALLAAPPPAGAGEEGGSRWVPGLAFVSGVTMAPLKAAAESSIVNLTDPTGIDHPPATGWLRDPESAAELDVSPLVGADLQLMSPTLPRLPGGPRLFLHGGVLATFGVERNIAQNGGPGEIVPPDKTSYFAEEIEGLGIRSRTELKSPAFGAGIGLAFPFEVWGRQLRLKPSAGWLRFEMSYAASLVHAACPDTINSNGERIQKCFPRGAIPAPARTFTFAWERAEVYDAIGPAIELELDAARVGPFAVSVFAGGSAHRIVSGERKVQFSDSVYYPLKVLPKPLPPPYTYPEAIYSARWSFEIDPWVYRAGVGVRFHWLGE